ncbi:unnamed protein product [Umbelopsis ramanniana]
MKKQHSSEHNNNNNKKRDISSGYEKMKNPPQNNKKKYIYRSIAQDTFNYNFFIQDKRKSSISSLSLSLSLSLFPLFCLFFSFFNVCLPLDTVLLLLIMSASH